MMNSRKGTRNTTPRRLWKKKGKNGKGINQLGQGFEAREEQKSRLTVKGGGKGDTKWETEEKRPEGRKKKGSGGLSLGGNWA